jgi:putative glycosyltransferase
LTSDVDVVYGKQTARKGKFFEKVSGSFFWNLFRLILGKDFPTDVTTARLMRRTYVNALLSFPEKELFIGGLWFITGFNQVPIEVNKLSKGTTTYTVKKKTKLFIDSITSFTNVPLVFVFNLGFLIFLISFGVAAFTFVGWFVENKAPEGWTSLLLSIWLLSGIMISSIGIVGIYLSKVYVEVKDRPRVIIKKKINF